MPGRSLPKTRRAVLGLVLYEHPKELTARELREEIGDDVRGAIVDLLAAGLVRREGDYIRPTREALNYHRLEQP